MSDESLSNQVEKMEADFRCTETRKLTDVITSISGKADELLEHQKFTSEMLKIITMNDAVVKHVLTDMHIRILKLVRTVLARF